MPFDQKELSKCGVAAFSLGTLFGVHLCIVAYCIMGGTVSTLLQWSLFAVGLSFFHFSEFAIAAAYRPSEVAYKCVYLKSARNSSKPLTVTPLCLLFILCQNAIDDNSVHAGP
jgi:hypothetical protein